MRKRLLGVRRNLSKSEIKESRMANGVMFRLRINVSKFITRNWFAAENQKYMYKWKLNLSDLVEVGLNLISRQIYLGGDSEISFEYSRKFSSNW